MTADGERSFGVALIGCGRISRNHVDAIVAIDGLDLVAACDVDAGRARALAEPLGIPWFTDEALMLEAVDCDIVTIATPSGLHPKQGILAARAGKHVVTEKPMATTIEGADDLLAACDEAGVCLFVVKQIRLNPAIQLLRRAIDNGRFGRLYLANCTVLWSRPQDYYDEASWRGTRELDGGAFMNQASHYVDLMQWMMGPVESVVAKTATLARAIETEDTGAAVLKFASGALGVIEVTMLTWPRNLEGSITVLGELGSVRIGGTAVNRVEHWEFAESEPEDELARTMTGTPPARPAAGHELYYRNVLAVLRGEADAEADGRAGRGSLELILGIHESARTGAEVRFPS